MASRKALKYMPEFFPQFLLPEDKTNRNVLKRTAFQCLNDYAYFFPYRFKNLFLDAGFIVQRVDREPYHPVWNIKLMRGTFDLSFECTEATRQIRRLLKANGIRVKQNAIAIAQNKKGITCSFVFRDESESDLA